MVQFFVLPEYSEDDFLDHPLTYTLLHTACPLCLRWSTYESGDVSRVILGCGSSFHDLLEGKFCLRGGYDGVARAITIPAGQSAQALTALQEIFREQDLKSPQVVCLLSQPRTTRIRERIQNEAFPIHESCFAMFSHSLCMNGEYINANLVAWFIAHSLRPIWGPTLSRVPGRRKAILLNAATGNSFAQLHDTFKTVDMEASSLFRQIHALPTELRLSIADYLEDSPLHDTLLILQQIQDFPSLARASSSFTVSQVDYSQDVYVQTSRFAGLDYLFLIQNEPTLKATRIPAPANPTDLVIELDEIGIISVNFAQDITFPPRPKPWITPPASWFRQVEIRPGLSTIAFERKGLLLWDCHSSHESECPEVYTDVPTRSEWKHFSWPLRSGAPQLNDIIYRRHTAMLSEKTRGVAVAWTPAGAQFEIVSLESNEMPRSSLDLVQGPRNIVYQYFPLAPGEQITHMWASRDDSTSESRGTLYLRTLCGRQIIFGPYIEPNSAIPREVYRIYCSNDVVLRELTYSTENLPNGVMYDVGYTYEQNGCMDGIAPTPDPPGFNSPVRSPLMTFDQEDFYGYMNQDWFYSSASLEGLKAVQLCSNFMREDQHTVGMMLYYDNDRRECLGQWRGDCELSPIYELPCRPLVYKYRYSNKQTPSVKVFIEDINLNRKSSSNQGFEDLPLDGLLVWWFSRYGDVLDHVNV